jgi:formate dehydrogenase maturation protein FdhE
MENSNTTNLKRPSAERDIAALERVLQKPPRGIAPAYIQMRLSLRRAQAVAEQSLLERRSSGPVEYILPVTIEQLPLDDQILLDLLAKIEEVAIEDSPILDYIAALKARATDQSISLSDVIRSLLGGANIDNLPIELGPAAQSSMLYSLVAPFYREFYRRIGYEVSEQSESGVSGEVAICPVCAASPALGKLRREDGRLLLWCARCDAEWLFPRIQCPACGTRDQEHLEIVHLDNDDLRWFIACNSCHSYLKCIDERKVPGTDPISAFAEDTQGLILDLFAAQQNLKPAW